MKTILAALAVVAIAGCTRSDSATRVLMDAGYTDVQITGYRFFGCGKEDTAHTGFRAKGPTGRAVTGVVCEGLVFKSSTIRLD